MRGNNMAGKWLGAIALVAVLAACGSSGESGADRPADGSAGIVAYGSAKQKVAADIAFVTTSSDEIFTSFDPSGSEPDGRKQLAELRARLKRLGLPKDAVHLAADTFDDFDGGLARARIEVPVAKLPKIARQVAAALDAATGTKVERGLGFAVSNCAKSITTARPEALKDARKNADALAAAAGVEVGELRSVSEGGSSAGGIGLSYLNALYDDQPCGRSALDAGYDSLLSDSVPAPLDAKPEVEIEFTVAANYDLDETAARTLGATGTGEESAAADNAIVFVIPEPVSSEFLGEKTTALSEENASKVAAAIAALKIPRADIDVDTDRAEGVPYIEVELGPGKVASVGPKIVAAVKRVLGGEPNATVLFTSKKCPDLVNTARKEAAADASLKIDGLAQAAGVEAGAIVGLAESVQSIDALSLGLFSGSPGIDPCATELSELVGPYGLSSITDLGSESGSLVEFDASPVVKKGVTITASRAITSD
jgi:uncharacterized protein YggE